MLRTCASIGVDDCETANGVTYCYCKNELCNNPSKKLSNPNPGSGLLSSPQKSTELLIDTNKQKIEGEVIQGLLNKKSQTVSCEIKFIHAHGRAREDVCEVRAKKLSKRACVRPISGVRCVTVISHVFG